MEMDLSFLIKMHFKVNGLMEIVLRRWILENDYNAKKILGQNALRFFIDCLIELSVDI